MYTKQSLSIYATEVARLILYAYAMEKITLEESQELSFNYGLSYLDDFWDV
jgi:hypothetical protein